MNLFGGLTPDIIRDMHIRDWMILRDWADAHNKSIAEAQR